MAQILLLTQTDCSFCDHAKAVLARLQDEFSLEVQVRDLASPTGQRLAVELGILFAPGIVLDGELLCYGRPSERGLRKALRRRDAMKPTRHASQPQGHDASG